MPLALRDDALCRLSLRSSCVPSWSGVQVTGSHAADFLHQAAALQEKLEEFMNYITTNVAVIPNYADRHRHGEPIATGFVESAVNQVVSKRFVKKQQMRSTPRGAHSLLQVRSRVLNQQLRGAFERWRSRV
jgi:hypothetical protein